MKELILEYINTKQKLDKVTNTDLYGIQRGVYEKDGEKFSELYNQMSEIKRKIKDEIGWWEYMKFSLDNSYLYDKYFE